ncbi:hypothetical protein IE81DRAFT_75703 [Ceraceosorus guamensis]|uniref:Zn(2)-C6 fungal-type domain-containing protein n=1 Tax=Ceraceosorus guamensis TaxID=1522189 RepID=A0A316W2Z4_9BASI|nr:hypothetical protein IE81DRAFT_75703 [Ceraceosorus guamensis]PWN43468.1 hypothetical protein IE81DRAFT_75703 [Ceraceosorus guamensis]
MAYYNQGPGNGYGFQGDSSSSSGPPPSSHHVSSESQHHHYPPHPAAGPSMQQSYPCPNCGKAFARDDLLRRHLAREARAMAQPSFDRQKSCQSCAASKARCDLEVPTCGRCRARGKLCVYGARSGNPNVRRAQRDSAMPSGWHPGQQAAVASPSWSGGPGSGSMYGVNPASTPSLPPTPGFAPEGSGDDYSSSEDSRGWSSSDQYNQYRNARSYSVGNSDSESLASEFHSQHGSFSYGDAAHQQQRPPAGSTLVSSFAPSFAPPARTDSPASFSQGGSTASQRGFARGGQSGSIDTSVRPFQADEGEETPIAGGTAAAGITGLPAAPQHANTIPGAMGPPTIPRGARNASAPFSGESIPPTGYSNFDTLQGAGAPGSRPQPPRLLTGSRMPVPGASTLPGLQTAFGSGRPLFSAQLDLSGWLEEPVVPSPLYRMGPSLSALGAAAHSFLPPTPTSDASANATRQALGGGGVREAGLRSMSDPTVENATNSSADVGMAGEDAAQRTIGQVSPEELSARHWWQKRDLARDADVRGQVASVCAGHFTLYPALLVLPDPTSPVPPLFHRPWMAQSRLATPSTLAIARVIIAGYHTRLPASEGFVWEQLVTQACRLTSQVDIIAANGDDNDVYAATAALWLYVVLLLMMSEPPPGVKVPADTTPKFDISSQTPHQVHVQVVDDGLVALSTLARTLSAGVKRLEAEREASRAEFLAWGFEETLRRILFATYALLVLQRLRESDASVQSKLAGADLVLDVSLPAGATEFEAGVELEWRAAQAAIGSERLTLRKLLAERGAESASAVSKAYFDRHDDFTNAVLTVAFALDDKLDPNA